MPRFDGVTFGDIPESSGVVLLLGPFATLGAIIAGMITFLSSVVEYGLGGSFGRSVADGSVADGSIELPIYEEAILNSSATAVETNRDGINTNAIRLRWPLELSIAGISFFVVSGLYVTFQAPFWHELGIAAGYGAVVGTLLVYVHGEAELVLERD